MGWSWPYRAFFSKALLFCWQREGLLDEEAPNQFLTGPPLLEWEGVVVMVIHSLPVRSSPPLLGNGRDDGRGHTQPPSKLPPSSRKGKGWWSWPYRAFFSKAL